jgi:hypothetical protein
MWNKWGLRLFEHLKARDSFINLIDRMMAEIEIKKESIYKKNLRIQQIDD